jgi:hypothetical protein
MLNYLSLQYLVDGTENTNVAEAVKNQTISLLSLELRRIEGIHSVYRAVLKQ